jgi:hypothetical protein
MSAGLLAKHDRAVETQSLEAYRLRVVSYVRSDISGERTVVA